MKRLLAGFPPMCLAPETKKKASTVVESTTNSANQILEVFRVHVDGNKLGADQENQIRSSLQNIMFELISITDLMEELQRDRCLRMVANAFRHLQIFRDTSSEFRLEEKLTAYVRDMKMLLTAMRQRSEVLAGGQECDELQRVTGEMETVIPLLVGAVKTAVQQPSDQATAARDEFIRGQAGCFQLVMKTLQNTYQASGSFDYTSLAEAMDLLEKAIQSGDRDAAVGQAREIADSIRVCVFL